MSDPIETTAAEGGPSGADTDLLLTVVRDLVSEEKRRDEAVNARAVAVVAFAAVALALAAGLERGLPLYEWSRGWRYLALAFALVGVLALMAAAIVAVQGVLKPRRFAMLSRAETKKFLTPEYLERSDALNRQVLLGGMVDILDEERTRIEAKTKALGRSYLFALIAVVSVAGLASLAALDASGIIGSDGREGQIRERPSGHPGGADAAAAGKRPGDSEAAPRVRREGSERSRP
jgi:MFS family permease